MIYSQDNINELEYINEIIFKNGGMDAEFDSVASYVKYVHTQPYNKKNGTEYFYILISEGKAAFLTRSNVSKKLYYRLASINEGSVIVCISVWEKFSRFFDDNNVSDELKKDALWLMNKV